MPGVTFQEAQLILSIWKTHPWLTSPWRPRNGVQLLATLTSEKRAPCSALVKVAGVTPVSTWLTAIEYWAEGRRQRAEGKGQRAEGREQSMGQLVEGRERNEPG